MSCIGAASLDLNQFVPDELKGEVNLRVPSQDDTDKCLDYFARLSEVSRGFFHPHPFDLEHAEHICQNDNPDEFRVFAEYEGKIVGYAWFGISNRFRFPVLGIGISDDFQGRRLGGALMDSLAAEAKRRGLPGLCLTVFKTNERGVKLYTSRGYRIVGEKGEEHVMELEFEKERT